MNKFVFGHGLLCLLLLGLIFSCAQDEPALTVLPEEGKQQDLTFQIAIPGAKSSLRSLGETEENTIRAIDILVFRTGEDGKEYFDYYAPSRKAPNNIEGSVTQSFTIAVRQKANQQRLVVIANAGAQVAALIASSRAQNREKNELLSELEYALTTPGDRWKTSSDYTALPMWGESGKITVTSATASLGTAIPLLRMVAKIDVQLDKSVPGITDKFKLKSLRLYNTHTKGRIAPHPGVVSAGAGNDRLYVTAPSIPAGAQIHYGPLVYSGEAAFASPGEPDAAMRGVIYAFETAVPADRDRLKATGLVIGGFFENDTQLSYYRVDFLNQDQSFRNILRNYRYEINIIAVDGRGYETPEEAWESKSANMDSKILVWDDSGMNDIAIDDQYYLSVNKNNFHFSIDACTQKEPDNILKVITDYHTSTNSGWKVESITGLTAGAGSDWLTITDAHNRTNLNARGEANIRTECFLSYTQNNTGGDRSVQVMFAAGRLRYPVIITQNTLERATIRFYHGDVLNPGAPIVNDTLIFYYNPMITHTDQKILVTWTPETSDLIAYEYPLSNTPFLPTTVKPGLQFLKAGAISSPGKTSHVISFAHNAALIGSSTRFVFIAGNGEQTVEKRLVISYLAP
ncbi:MAG: hypothetical protein LBH19_03185 [Dysgonamonadaceae bacterium]|nr:hypothetical protein [Dysgonamonadaceae bacterium]